MPIFCKVLMEYILGVASVLHAFHIPNDRLQWWSAIEQMPHQHLLLSLRLTPGNPLHAPLQILQPLPDPLWSQPRSFLLPIRIMVQLFPKINSISLHHVLTSLKECISLTSKLERETVSEKEVNSQPKLHYTNRMPLTPRYKDVVMQANLSCSSVSLIRACQQLLKKKKIEEDQ
jgi:hypothetical protein